MPKFALAQMAVGKFSHIGGLRGAELDAAEFKTEYLVEWLLVAGQPCIVAGQKKALKTSILLDLAIALAIAGRFLGFFRVTRTARVCVMTGESGLATIQETLRRIAAAAGCRLAEIDNLVISDQLPLFGNLEHLELRLKRLLIEDSIEVLILDPAYLCIPADGHEGSLFAMGQLLRGLSEMCQSLGVTLVLAHHTKWRRCRSVRSARTRGHCLGRFSGIRPTMDFAGSKGPIRARERNPSTLDECRRFGRPFLDVGTRHR